jgi:hypothetical protein
MRLIGHSLLVPCRLGPRGPVMVLRRWDCNEKNLQAPVELPVVAVPVTPLTDWKSKLRLYAELGESCVHLAASL